MSSPTWAPRKRRNTELAMLIVAIALAVGARISVELAVNETVPASVYTFAVLFAAVALAAHFAVRFLLPYADPILLPLVVALNGIGITMIHRIDLARQAANATAGSLATSQMTWTVVGIAGFITVIAVVRDHRILQKYTYTFGFIAIALLLMPLLPVVGQEIRGARLWIHIGPFSFQPGEAAKISLAIFFAGYLVVKRDALALAGKRFAGIDWPRGRDLGPIVLAWLLSLGILVFQRDLGSSLLFFGLFVVVLYVATERPGWVFVGSGLFVVGAWFGYMNFSHVQLRVSAWLDPWANPDQNFQIINALYGMAHGGVLGRGWGEGRPKLTPFSFSDFILTSLGEELGLTGLMAVLMIYVLIVERGVRIALTCRDAFGKLLAIGLTASMAFQVFVVTGGVTRLIPLTGLTTPFLAHGGSSIVMNWAIIALLLIISHQTRRPAPEVLDFSADEETQVVKLK